MPEWVHNRAEHLLAKNPSMPKSMAFAIATQQGESGGHVPKGFGTAEGRRTSKAKFSTPKDDERKANPGGLETPKLKHAAIGPMLVSLLSKVGFAPSAFGGQPAQNPPGMKGQSQVPPFVAPPLEVKAASALKPIKDFAKTVGGQSTKLREASIHHLKSAREIENVLNSRLPLHKTVELPAMRGGWAHTSKALETDAKRHARAGHLSSVLAGVADKETANARKALGAGVLAAGTAGGLAAHHIKSKEAGVGAGAGMSTSQYSGPLSFGPFKQTSGIPPFTRPPLTAPEKTAEMRCQHGLVISKTAGCRTCGYAKTAAPMASATGAMGPKASLTTTQRVGQPKTTGFAGPSIAEVSKPKGFGTPLSGTLKNQL